MLARITGFLEEISGKTSNYCDYVNIAQKSPYEIEHITSDHYEWFTDEYSTQEEFYAFRNNVGDLVLLNKHINASLNDKLLAIRLRNIVQMKVIFTLALWLRLLIKTTLNSTPILK